MIASEPVCTKYFIFPIYLKCWSWGLSKVAIWFLILKLGNEKAEKSKYQVISKSGANYIIHTLNVNCNATKWSQTTGVELKSLYKATKSCKREGHITWRIAWKFVLYLQTHLWVAIATSNFKLKPRCCTVKKSALQ